LSKELPLNRYTPLGPAPPSHNSPCLLLYIIQMNSLSRPSSLVKFFTELPSYLHAPNSTVPNQIFPEVSSPMEKILSRELPWVFSFFSFCCSVKLITFSPSYFKTPIPLLPIQRFPLLSSIILRVCRCPVSSFNPKDASFIILKSEPLYPITAP